MKIARYTAQFRQYRRAFHRDRRRAILYRHNTDGTNYELHNYPRETVAAVFSLYANKTELFCAKIGIAARSVL